MRALLPASHSVYRRASVTVVLDAEGRLRKAEGKDVYARCLAAAGRAVRRRDQQHPWSHRMPGSGIPTVSVIIPTHDRADLVQESVRSVLNQEFEEYEVIVVDDGSTDDTKSVIKQFDDHRIRYIYQENKGTGAARNTGIRSARGRYIAFLDSDDVWRPTLLASLVPVLERNPDAGVAYAKAQAIDSSGNLKAQISGAAQKYPGETLRSVLEGDFVCIIATVVRRDCLSRIGMFDETLRAREDWDIWVRLAKHYSFIHVPEVLAFFRMHPGRQTSEKSERFPDTVESTIKVLDKAFSDPDLKDELLAIQPVAYRNAYMEIGMGWLSALEWRKSARSFAKAVLISRSPLSTIVRVTWLALFYNLLSKCKWSSKLVSRVVDLRRRSRRSLIL